MPRRRIPTLIVAAFPSRSPRYTQQLTAEFVLLDIALEVETQFCDGARNIGFDAVRQFPEALQRLITA